MNEDISARELLAQVNLAISSILVGGQSYRIGSRELTRADLKMLNTMKTDLTAQLSSEGGSSLFDNTYVAVFEGR